MTVIQDPVCARPTAKPLHVSDYLTDTSPLSHKYNYKFYMITEETFAKVKSPAQDHMLVF